MTYESVAEQAGTSYDVLNNMANARTNPDYDLLEKVRQILNLPKGWPQVALAGKDNLDPNKRYTPAGTPMVKVPVVGAASAGPPNTYVDPDMQTIWIPERLAAVGKIAKVVDGDSMMPWLLPDDFAVFKERRTPRNKFAFLLRTQHHEDRIKLTVHNGREWELQSINPMYPPEPMKNAQLEAILVGYFRQRGTRETMDSDPEGLMPDYELLELTRALFAQNDSA